MTRENILRMARLVRDGGHWNQIDIVNFGLLVAAAEREACAELCERVGDRDTDFHAYDAAAAIRARENDAAPNQHI